MGTVSIIPNNIKEANLNSALVRLDLNLNKIDKKYFCYLFDLSITRIQIEYIGKGAAQNNLNNNEISQIKIPLPPLEIQNQIVSIMDKAYQTKKQKEYEAESLLNSIDNYVLGELGIKVLEVEEKMCFKVNMEDMGNNRFDSFYHQPKFELLEKSIKSSRYKIIKLNEIILDLISGARPKGGVRQIKEGIPSLGGEHVLNDGTIETEDLKYIPIDFHKNNLKSKILKNDILLVKDGATTGKVGIIKDDFPFDEANVNEHVFILRTKKDILPFYLFLILRSSIGQTMINREITGGTIMGITRDVIDNIIIPLPPLDIQEKIANEVKSWMDKAKRLKEDAKKVLDEAKKEVEKIIFGE